MTNYPADTPEDHPVPRHAGTLADDRDEPAGLHEARPADFDADDADGERGDTDSDADDTASGVGQTDVASAYANSADANDADADSADADNADADNADADNAGYGEPLLAGTADDDDPDVIVVGETPADASAATDDQLADPNADPLPDAFAVDSSGEAEPVDAASPGFPAPDIAGPDAADIGASGSSPADGDTANGDTAGAGSVVTDTAVTDTAVTGTAASTTAAAAPAGPPQVADPAGSDATQLQERWLAIQSDFVDDPHRSVAAAAELVEGTIASMIADIKQQESSLRGSWDDSSADTEVLRKALVDYRSFLDRLAAM